MSRISTTLRATSGCLALVLAACLGPGARPAHCGVPMLINYQGQLSNGGGPVNGTFAMDFALYAAESGGSPLWSESYASIAVTGGVFTVLLGGATPLPVGSLFTGSVLWIETTVDGNMMAPRRPIVSVAYAARAAIADSAVAVPSAVPPGAVVYTRWGRTTCPPGASVVHQGRVGGSYYNQSGGGSNLLCLSSNPTWDQFSDNNQNGALVYGAEYQMTGFGLSSLGSLQNLEVPCAVCLRENARVSLMIPGTQTCPAGWTAEYAGYLMSSHYTQIRSELVCVDRAPEGVGSAVSSSGALLYPTEAECGSLPCGPYVQDRELTCVVCVKP